MKYEIEQIGTIYSPYASKEDCPIQGRAAPEGVGRVEVFPEYEDALETIETFSHIFLLYLFDQAGKIELSRPTFLDDAPHGVFASRHPCRPNSIGMSIVRLEARKGNILEIREIDMLDNTPLLDIKPYMPKYDCRAEASNGWVEGKAWRDKPKHRE